MIGLDESVTWRAKHFGIYQTLTSRITEFGEPNYFTDEMVKGAFKRFKHEHRFFEINAQITLMVDIFDYASPHGILGRIADMVFLEKYITRLLETRNKTIREFAETNRWKEVIQHKY